MKWLGGERLWYCCAAAGEDKGCDAAFGNEHCGLGLESGSEEEKVDNDGELCLWIPQFRALLLEEVVACEVAVVDENDDDDDWWDRWQSEEDGAKVVEEVERWKEEEGEVSPESGGW